MKRVYVTFGGASYDGVMAQTLLALTGLQCNNGCGVDELRVYDDAWLKQSDFYKLNEWIFHLDKEGNPAEVGYHFGWCSWKAYILLDTMLRLQPGDIVLYVDGDTYPIADLTPLFEIAQREGIVLCEAQGCNNNRWTKKECFVTMGIPEEQYSSQHACGRFQLFTAWDWRSMQFLMEWQTYLLNPLCQFNAGSSTCEDHPEFHRHSSDQSSLSNLAMKYKIPLHREACQNGWPILPNTGQPGDTYGQLFVQEWAEGDRADLSGSKFRNV